MKILNPRNLPEPLVRAVSREEGYAPNPNRMSVTDLIGPPMIRFLKLKHWDEITEVVENMTWMMFGTAFHLLMDKHSGDAISEQKIEYDYPPYTIVGVPDVHKDGILYDYKVIRAYALVLSGKAEWVNQLNTYVWLLKQSKGIDIKEIKIIAILRDWSEITAEKDQNYPQAPLWEVRIPLWDPEYAYGYIVGRMAAHSAVVPCSPEEKWTKPDTFAVKVKGIKKAKRVLDSMAEAEKWMANNPQGKKGYIETRPGEDSRCKRYCSVSQFCEYNRYLKKEEEDD